MNILNIATIDGKLVNELLSDKLQTKVYYDDLVSNSKQRGLDKTISDEYYEIHHIVPRCKQGTNDEENLVMLTYREHIIAHLLLYCLEPDNKDLFLSFSLLIQLKGEISEIQVDLSALEIVKSERSKFMKGDLNPMKNPEIAKKVSKKKKNQPGSFLGKHHSEESRKKISESKKGQRLGRRLSEETKEKLSIARSSKVEGPDGTLYRSIKEAARIIGVSRPCLSKWIKNSPEKGWRKL